VGENGQHAGYGYGGYGRNVSRFEAGYGGYGYDNCNIFHL
jgi:hypothetical protein